MSNQPHSNQIESKDILTAAKGGGISFAGKIFEYIARFAFGILIARTLGVEQYGVYTLAMTVPLIVSNMAMLGLQVGIARFLPPAIRLKDDQSMCGILQVCVGLPAFFSLFLAAGLFLFAGPLAALMFHNPTMTPLLRIVAFMIPLDTLAFMAFMITISFKQLKYNVIARNVIGPLLRLLLSAGFLAIGLSIKGILMAQVITSVAVMAVLVYFVNALFPLRRAFGSARNYTGQLLRYSIPVHLGWMVNALSSYFSTFVLGFLGLASGVGVLTAASGFNMIGTMLYSSVGYISTPIIADLHCQRNNSQLKAYYQTTARWLVTFNVPVFLTSVLFARQLLWIFGEDFTAGATSMVILAFGTLAYTCTGFGAIMLDMTDHPKVNTINSVIITLVCVALNVLLIPRWDVNGAAAAASISTVLVNVACLIEVLALDGLQPYNRSFIKPLLAGFVTTLVVYPLNHFLVLPPLLQLIVGGGTLWCVYGIALYLLKLSPEDQIVIEHLLYRFRAMLPAT